MPSEENAGEVTDSRAADDSPRPNEPNWIWQTFFANRAPAWTAVATIALGVFSFLLWKVNDRANETSIDSQRAFINFTGPLYVQDIQNNVVKGTNVYWGMSNSGTTPANAVVFEWNLSLGQSVPDKPIDFDSLSQNEREHLVLGPKANYQMKPVYISLDDWEKVVDGKEHLFFWGWAVYRDVFTDTPPRVSEFCTDITSAAWVSPKIPHSSLKNGIKTVNPSCPTHNCYDENCEDYRRRIE